MINGINSGYMNFNYQGSYATTRNTNAKESNSGRDTVEITDFKANERATLEYATKHNMIVAKQQAKARAEESKRVSRAVEIMSKMSSGTKVSREDLQFLQEYNPEMYKVALQAAMMAERKEIQEEKHLAKQHKESVANEPSEDYTKELKELNNTFKDKLQEWNEMIGDNYK